MDTSQAPTKPCHNCRRQRLRCDRSYPQCNKCAAAGKECLGYGKLFRWTGAIASRGKLAGRTSSAPLDAKNSSQQAPLHLRAARSLSPEYAARNLLDAGSPTDARDDGRDMQLIIPRARSADVEVTAPWILVDPIFQDLNPSYRYYLNYFSDRLCKDLVSHDVPDCNPFRSLLPLTRDHPLLQHIIVAASAAHMSVLFRSTPAQADGFALPVSSREVASKAALNDALVAKHKALRLMSSALQDVESAGGDAVLAAALFFVNVELIESGKHGWRAHLEGAGRILSLIQHTKAWDSSLRDYLLSDCFIYFILATAFMPPDQEAIKFESSQIPFVLAKTAANSYFCCPPDILEILHTASELSSVNIDNGTEDEVAAAAIALLHRAQAFDVETWAADIRSISSLQGVCVESRGHAGSAHRAAACLYILQAIPAVGKKCGRELTDTLIEEIYYHLSSIPDHDPNFKATSWPTFIAGAETVSAERRAWIMDRLRRLVSHCPWGFIYTAMDTLPILWSLAEEQMESTSWVQILKDPDLNFLIV
ncbi:Acriflavine sensitivity control protein acr-2 [Cladobotryum mycophilum]|uniref:Acriflavine sensitivity control protein acr-2 n=1 Tax=Cladobotryum mycophilum TaxID=491253 RepID=A0ABR0SHM7_9HYPO